jgi:predicted nucleotidyltransferase component of viral defense system
MFEQALSKDAKKSLAVLGKSGLLKNAYMAGGTALALQMGHRVSVDFDFFTPEEFNGNILIQRIKKLIPDFELERMEWGTILGRIKKIRFSLFFYSYPLLFKTRDFSGIKIANIKDIAAMKIAAIADRGTKRDFIDLYFIIGREEEMKTRFSFPPNEPIKRSIAEKKKTLSLREILELYDKKFKLLKQNKMHILKSLCYFDDAEKSKMPKMIKDVSWKEVKEKIKTEVKKMIPL